MLAEKSSVSMMSQMFMIPAGCSALSGYFLSGQPRLDVGRGFWRYDKIPSVMKKLLQEAVTDDMICYDSAEGSPR